MDTWSLIGSLILGGIGSIILALTMDRRRRGGCLIITIGIVVVISGIIIFFPFDKIISFLPAMVPNKLVFAGKIVDGSTNKWTNNRLVLLFLEGKEVGRAVSKLGKFVESGQGVHDGLYTITVSNLYELQLTDLNDVISDTFKLSVINGTYSAYYWHDPFYEGDVFTIKIPTKNIQYAIKSIEGDISLLPKQMLITGTATLKSDNTIVINLQGNSFEDQPYSESNVLIKNMVYNSDGETVDVSKLTIPIDNCGGSVRVEQKYTHTQTFIHEYSSESVVGGSIELPLGAWFQVMLELQTKYGFENGQIDTKTIEYDMGAEPRTKVQYVIKMQEIWESGTAEVNWAKDNIEMPFKVKTNLVYSINSEKIACS